MAALSIFRVGDKVAHRKEDVVFQGSTFSRKDNKDFGRILTIREIHHSHAGNVLFFEERLNDEVFGAWDFEIFFELEQAEANKRLRESEKKWFRLREEIGKVKALANHISKLQKEVSDIDEALTKLEVLR